MRETIQQRRIVDRGTNFYKLAFEIFIGGLEEGKQTPSRYAI